MTSTEWIDGGEFTPKESRGGNVQDGTDREAPRRFCGSPAAKSTAADGVVSPELCSTN
jgi:hypothetical protein